MNLESWNTSIIVKGSLTTSILQAFWIHRSLKSKKRKKKGFRHQILGLTLIGLFKNEFLKVWIHLNHPLWISILPLTQHPNPHNQISNFLSSSLSTCAEVENMQWPLCLSIWPVKWPLSSLISNKHQPRFSPTLSINSLSPRSSTAADPLSILISNHQTSSTSYSKSR